MPTYTVPYAPTRAYQYSGTLGELARQRADAQAALRAKQGDLSAQRWSSLGSRVAGTLGDIAKYRAAAPERELAAEERRARIAESKSVAAQREATLAATVSERERKARQEAALRGLLDKYPDGQIPPRELFTVLGPQAGAEMVKALTPPVPPRVPTREIKVRRPDGSEEIRIVRDEPGQTFTSEPEPKPAEKLAFGAPVAAMVGGRRMFVRAGSDGKTYDMRGQVVTEATPEPIPPQGPSPGAPVAVIGPDGKPVFVSQAGAVGRTPASIREQGRAVTSGDAGRIADFDTALDDLTVLRGTIAARDPKTGTLIEPGSTGTAAAVSAKMPDWVTEWTGIGATAKSKQAVIDRVKQVIGKALEGGVLRREDEYKYAKILPTIRDVASVVETKLQGLDDAIAERRQTTLDALDDAGYDVSKFRARTAAEEDDADFDWIDGQLVPRKQR